MPPQPTVSLGDEELMKVLLTLDESTTESKIIGVITACLLVVCLSSTYCSVGRATSLVRPTGYFIGAVLAGVVVISFLVGASKPSNWWRLYADAAPFGLVLAAALALTLSFTGTGWRSGRAAEGADSTMPDVDATLELIKRRRSVFPKDFSGQRVPRAALEQCLEAANWAPTHGKTEPWRFVVFEGDGIASLEGAKREATARTLAGQPEALRAQVTLNLSN